MLKHPKTWKLLVLLACTGFTGCATTQSAGFWGSMNPTTWFSSKATAKQSALTQKPPTGNAIANPSTLGANGRLGAGPPRNNSWLSSMAAPLTRNAAAGQSPAQGDDALRLDVQPKQVSPQIFVQVARVYEAKGDYASALKQYEQALKIAPQNTEVLLGMARAYDRKGDYALAVGTYEQAANIEPNNAVVFNDLGLCFARHGELPRAQLALERAVAIASTSKLYRNNLATVLVQQNRYDDALQQLLAVLPEPSAHYNLGFLAERHGNRAVALQQFQQAAALDPQLAAARQMIDKLTSTASQLPTATQIESRMTETAASAEHAAANNLHEAEQKIRGVIQSQTSSFAPRYAAPISAPSDSYNSDYASPTTTTTPVTTPVPLPPLGP